MSTTIISILIPTYNAENYIEELVKALDKQKIGPDYIKEVIIVDSSSTDNTINILKRLAATYEYINYYVIENKMFDHGGTRNFMAQLAKGKYLLYMTQDAIPYDNLLLANLLEDLKKEDVLLAYARQLPKKDASDLEIFARSFNYPNRSIIKEYNSISTLGIKAFFNSNVCCMYNRECFESYEGFPENIILNEDMILASKIILDQKKISYNASAKVLHSHNYNLIQQFKRYFDIGIAFENTRYLLKYASNEKEGLKMVKNQLNYLITKRKRHLIPYAILENVIKYFGYYIGKKHKLFPIFIKKKMSAYMK